MPLLCKADMTAVEVRQFCQVEPSAQALLQAAMKGLALSARAFHRILKLARTIADLSASSRQALSASSRQDMGGDKMITAAHLAEALQYRPREMG